MTTLARHLQIAKKLVTILDTKFHVFGLRFGIDPLFDVIPGVGNIIAAVTSCYIFWIAKELQVPTKIYVQMLWNILLDYLFGVVPIVGIVFDLLYKSNLKNYALLEKYFDPEILIGKIVDQ